MKQRVGTGKWEHIHTVLKKVKILEVLPAMWEVGPLKDLETKMFQKQWGINQSLLVNTYY